ncbi:MAG: RNA polymerase sigma factor [Gemmataceae bacterium]
MGTESGPVTSATLLGRLQRAPADAAAWREFAERYGTQIFGWCRGRGLQAADAEDVTQTILAKLLVVMRSFTYDPSQSFRAWLRTVTDNTWRDLMRGSRRDVLASALDVDSSQSEAAARDDLMHRLEVAHDCELLVLAQGRVRLRVEPATWEAFRLTALEQVAANEVAARLGMKVATVYKARSNVQKLLRDEMDYLDGGGV